MQISFIILFLIDLYQDNHVHSFLNFFFEKLLRNYGLDFYQISQECSLDRGYKLLFTVTEKSGLWSDTGAQAPLVYNLFLLYRTIMTVNNLETEAFWNIFEKRGKF